MAEFEVNPAGGLLAPVREGEPEIVGVPGEICVLDGGVPWVRDRMVLDQAWAVLQRALGNMTREPGRDYMQISGADRAVLGTNAAARWCLRYCETGPMTQVERRVSGAGIRVELREAEAQMVSREHGWERSTGVLYWLLWITGATETLLLPGWPRAGQDD